MKYKVKFVAYCGISFNIEECDARAEALAVVTKQNERAKSRKQEVVQLDRDTWEHCEPEDAVLVPDNAGWLSIVEVRGLCCGDCDTKLEQDGRNTWYCPSCDMCPECSCFDGHNAGCSEE